MRLRPFCLAAFSVPLLTMACSDNQPSYPAIIIYGNDGSGLTGSGLAGSGLTGSGNTTSNGGGDSMSNGGTSNGGGATTDPLYAHCNNLWSGQDPPVKTQCDLDTLTDGGEITGDITKDTTWTTGKSYRLKGGVRVLPGVTLTIQPCVKVIGESSDATLAVLAGAAGNPDQQCFFDDGSKGPGPGAKLIAVGEPMAPIVFTSSKPKGQRAPSDWGGVLLMGNAHNNLALSQDDGSGTRVPIEGLARPECHGWYNSDYDAESTGKLEYVRIEYASQQLSLDNETNGLSLASLGSGTELHYVEVSNSGDDCFEWFGGAVNGDHLIALNCDDDMFDGDNGFSGKLQFLFGRQYPTTTETDSRGFEIDGAPSVNNLPLSTESAINFTLCGGGPTDRNTSRDGAVVRSLASGVSLTNGILTGFGGHGMFVNQDSAAAQFTYVDMFNNAAGIYAGADAQPGRGGMGETTDWFLQQQGNTIAPPDRFCNCWANPPVPVAASTAPGKKPSGFPDESAAYVGAFKDNSADSNWMRGLWVDWSSN
jgi:hypothetical protein